MPCGSCLTVNLVSVTQTAYVNGPGLSVTHGQVIRLCRQTDVHWGAVEQLLSCLHSPSYSANSRAWEFVQVVTVEQLIPSVWHKVTGIVWAALWVRRKVCQLVSWVKRNNKEAVWASWTQLRFCRNWCKSLTRLPLLSNQTGSCNLLVNTGNLTLSGHMNMLNL